MTVPVQIAEAFLPRLGRVASNVGNALKNYSYGFFYNMDSFKNNALVLSSLLQVSSRIFVANKTARQSKGSADEAFVFSECVKTTVREALAFCLSFLVLRKVQGLSGEFFRNLLWVTKGAGPGSPMFRWLFKGMFSTPKAIVEGWQASTHGNLFPTFRRTMGQIASQVRSLVTGRPIHRIPSVHVESIFPTSVEPAKVFFDSRRQPVFNAMKPFIDRLHKWTGGKLTDTNEEKLATFFTWVPPLIGSVPALLLSGWWLERFTQKNAKSVAGKIAGFFTSDEVPVSRESRFSSYPFRPQSNTPSLAHSAADIQHQYVANQQPLHIDVTSVPPMPVRPMYPNMVSYPMMPMPQQAYNWGYNYAQQPYLFPGGYWR